MPQASQNNEAETQHFPQHNKAISLSDAIGRCKLFEGLSWTERNQVVKEALHRRASRGLIIHSGEPADRLFLLGSGSARYFRVTHGGDEYLMWWLSPGDVFGLGTLLRNQPGYIGSVEPVKHCELLVWRSSVVHRLCSKYPQLRENALRITLLYLSYYVQRHSSVISDTAEHRLADTLVDLGHRIGRTDHQGSEIEITNEHLGQLADVSLFTAARLLSAWERKGAVVKKRGKVLLKVPELLPID